MKMKKGTCHHDKLVALRRIEGQVGGVQRMVEEGRYCIDILNAIGAILGALKTVETNILRDHLKDCVSKAFAGSDPREKAAKIEEICRALGNFRK